MYLVPDIRLQTELIKWSRYLIIPVIIIGILVLIGWEFDIIILRAPLNHTIAMNPVTATCFLSASFSFLLLSSRSGTKYFKPLGYLLAILVLFVAVVKFLAIFSIIDIGIDRSFFSTKLAPPNGDAMPSNMAPFTAFSFFMLGCSLLMFNKEINKKIAPGQFTALLMGLTGLLSLLGYVYQSNAFSGVLHFTPMALHSAICFILLSIAFLFSSTDRGVMREMTSSFTGSITARSLIPAAVIIPALLGLVRLYGNRIGLYSNEFGVAVFAIGITIIFFILIWYNTVLLNKRDIAKAIIEEELKKGIEQNAYLASLLNNTSDAVFSTDQYFRIKSWNKAAEKLYGFAANEAIGKTTQEIIRTEISKADRESMRSDLRKTGYNKSEIIHFAKNGARLDLLASTTVAKNPQGEIYGFITICHDISSRKKLESQLQQINAELEGFTYSVSHDLRAPLRGIIGFTAILEEEYSSKLGDEARRITNIIKNNALKMGNLIDDLLNFSRLGRHEINKTIIQMEQMVDDVIADQKMVNKAIAVKWIVHSLPVVKGDINTMRQVWINLIDNAVKYSRNNPAPVIEIGTIDKDGQPVFFVKDNGVGFDEKYSNKLFKVFQRLHSNHEFEGTGVGLALVEKIISRHGGRIWAEASLGNGATFYFTL